jgi:hypothetical protein
MRALKRVTQCALIFASSGFAISAEAEKKCRFNRPLTPFETSVVRAVGCQNTSAPATSKLLQELLNAKAEAVVIQDKDVPELVKAQVTLKGLRRIETSRPRAMPLLLENLELGNFTSQTTEILFRSAVFTCTDGMETELNLGALEKLALKNPGRFVKDFNAKIQEATRLTKSTECSEANLDERQLFDQVLTQIYEVTEAEIGRPNLRSGWTKARGSLLPPLQEPLPIWKLLAQP